MDWNPFPGALPSQLAALPGMLLAEVHGFPMEAP